MDTTPAPAPEPEPNKPDSKRHRSAQDTIIESFINDSKKLLKVASEDEDIRPILEKHGYDQAELDIGNSLATAASTAFEKRATGMGNQLLTTELHNKDLQVARDNYAAFREIARAAFPSNADRTGLSLRGEVPDDTGEFITLAETSYGAAGKDPYKTKMTKRGYDDTRLKELLTNLTALTNTGGEQDQAMGDAIDDTSDRDVAYKKLKEYIMELKGTARGALRGKKGLLAKLDL